MKLEPFSRYGRVEDRPGEPRSAEVVYDFAIHPDGSRLVKHAAYPDRVPARLERRVYLTDLRSWMKPESPKLPRPHAEPSLLDFDATGRFLRFATLDGAIGTWDCREGALVHTTRQTFSPPRWASTADDRWVASLGGIAEPGEPGDPL